jgi:hypothetical protein
MGRRFSPARPLKGRSASPLPGARGFLRPPGVESDPVALRAAPATQAVYGIPLESTTSHHTGSMHGPRAIRDASEQFPPCHHDFYLDPGDAIGLVGCGDAAVVAGSAEKTFARARAGLGELCAAGRRGGRTSRPPAAPRRLSNGRSRVWVYGGAMAVHAHRQSARAALRTSWFGLRYLVGHHVLREDRPLIRGLVLTNRCNLHCRHCRVSDRDPMDLRFSEVTAAVDAFYAEGGRCLYLEGGEPFLWRDGAHRLDDIVAYAHGLGYLTVVVYTNGTLPLRTSADTVFVSVDGLQATHDALRGTSFERIMGNIRESPHPSLFINSTINARNKDEIRAFCDHVEALRTSAVPSSTCTRLTTGTTRSSSAPPSGSASSASSCHSAGATGSSTPAQDWSRPSETTGRDPSALAPCTRTASSTSAAGTRATRSSAGSAAI